MEDIIVRRLAIAKNRVKFAAARRFEMLKPD